MSFEKLTSHKKEKGESDDASFETDSSPADASIEEIISLVSEEEGMDFSLSSGETDVKLISRREREQRLKELIFGYLICQDLQEHIVREFEDKEVPNDVIEAVITEFKKLSIEERKQVLAWPRELRMRRDERSFFSRAVNRLIDTEDAVEFLETLRSVAADPSRRWTIGYHISKADISPRSDGSWSIKATENDHRDNDLPRAYYSLSYEMLYREKMGLGSHLYLIRASENDANDGKWWRANDLSVIHRVGVHEFDVKTNEYYKALMERVSKTDRKR